jgi:hypothetical protein
MTVKTWLWATVYSWQWSVKCSHGLYLNEFNNSNRQYTHSLWSPFTRHNIFGTAGKRLLRSSLGTAAFSGSIILALRHQVRFISPSVCAFRIANIPYCPSRGRPYASQTRPDIYNSYGCKGILDILHSLSLFNIQGITNENLFQPSNIR